MRNTMFINKCTGLECRRCASFLLLMFLKDKLIFNLTRAKHLPWKWSYRERSCSTRQFLKRKLLSKKWINFYHHPFTVSSENDSIWYSCIQGQLINFISTELRKLSLGQKLFIYIWYTETLCFQNWPVTHFMIDYYATSLIFSHLWLKEAGGKSFQSKISENQVTRCPAFSAGSSWVIILWGWQTFEAQRCKWDILKYLPF